MGSELMLTMDTCIEPSSEFESFGPYTEARKLNTSGLTPWQHHRGGWKYVCRLLAEHLHCDDGIRFIGSVEDEIAERKVIAEPWVGVVHQVPKNNLRWFPDLERLLNDECWKASAQNCLGVFVLSTYVKDYLQSHGCPVPVARLFYPVEETDHLFSFERFANGVPKRLVCGGEFLRNFQAFYDLRALGFSKQLLVHEGFKWDSIIPNDSVLLLGRVSDEEYDALLEESVVYLNLFDAPANTTVVECIVRNTPVLINQLPGVVEYLGDDYPFYYQTSEEAEWKLQQMDLIRQTSDYLKQAPIKRNLTRDFFLASVQNSAIYRSLPIPLTQPGGWERYDVSVVICSYKRVYNIDALLQAFIEQDFNGRFEVIVWNNNYEARHEIDDLYKKYQRQLALKVIHSTENFYCVIRLAMASLIRSGLILICDDDVKPLPSYISTFVNKSEEYGTESVLCCRGHVFKPHTLNEERPEQFWTNYEHLKFYDETKTDRQVHFLHADNCLIPKELMQKALSYPIERYEYWLIDDYWLSFVFSHVLKIPIWKIKADDILTFTKCADDPKIALYHNPKVTEQRINFYIYHMRKGWPFPVATRRVWGRKEISSASGEKGRTECWVGGFGGVNMFSAAPEADFERAAKAGVTVVRFGAVGDAQDFRYLIDESGMETVLTEEALTRLADGIRRAGDCGMRVIIAPNHAPGRIFSIQAENYDFRLWSSPACADRFVEMWGELSKYLRCFDNVVGYDLLNEPFTPDDISPGYFDEMSEIYVDALNSLYDRTIRAIRNADSVTPIILESTYWASPRTLKFLRTYDDPGIVYSFHMYAPPVYTMRWLNSGRFAYPGPVPNWPDSVHGGIKYWNKETLRAFLAEVKSWQESKNIPNGNIFVGEVGVTREAEGAQRYLVDLLDLFDEFGWNWAIYAFRDEEWDAMDYELGPDINSMFPTESNELFARLRTYFR
jgi:glycosyltransferase involved in cell wall biosynthesis